MRLAHAGLHGSSPWLLPVLACLLALALALPSRAQAAPYKIVTASPTGTYIQIGRDLAKLVAEPAGLTLDVLESKGSAENVNRMRFEPGVKLALVQSDVYQAFLDEANAGNADAGNIIRPLRVVLPLYPEEIYFVVRADSPLQSIHQIRDQRIGVGPIGSGTALTARTLYQQMFGKPIPADHARYLDNEEALAQLTVEKSIDVAVIVAGQPAKLFTAMKPEARNYIKLLRLDDSAPEATRAKSIYLPASIRSASYANWLQADVPTLAVQAFLVTYDYNLQATVGDLGRLADSLCANFDQLQSQGHPKWKQVQLDLPPLGKGWRYYPPMEKRLKACIAQRVAGASGTLTRTALPRTRPCTEQEVVLGICRRP